MGRKNQQSDQLPGPNSHKFMIKIYVISISFKSVLPRLVNIIISKVPQNSNAINPLNKIHKSMKEIIVTMSEIIILKFKQGRVQQKRVFKVT